MDQYLLSLDEGTTSARAIIYDNNAEVKSIGQHQFDQYYPHPGWVEQNPHDIWNAQKRAIIDALQDAKIEANMIHAIGVTNQRETIIIWDKQTGTPIYNAIVWQCRRTADIVEQVKQNYGELIKEKTGLIPDSYFSAPKVNWILNNIKNSKEKAESGQLLLGTIDSYLIYKLTRGKTHATDPSNASRTLLYNIHTKSWDLELLELFKIPESMLPEVKPSSGLIGYTEKEVFGASIPIMGCAGDQQAALFGHTAIHVGDSKCTFGTGNFLLMNTGKKPAESKKLLTTIAWKIKGETVYALEGSIFNTGTALQWLRDGLGIIETVEESETIAESLTSSEGVYMVPAFTGLGAPYWNQYVRGTVTGITRGTTRAHIVRAALESIAFQTYDIVELMQQDSGKTMNSLRVDGGASRNRFLMQFQSDVLNIPIIRPIRIEATARGTAYLAGLASDVWDKPEDLSILDTDKENFNPKMLIQDRNYLLDGWRQAVRKTLLNKG